MTRIESRFAGVGSYLPENIVTNADLEARVDTNDEWIRSRTGIAQRHIAADNEATSDIAAAAARRALDDAGVSADAIDLIVVATVTPDKTFPSVAAHVQAKIAAGPGMAFDVSAACGGFVYALNLADAMIRTRPIGNWIAHARKRAAANGAAK